MERIAREVEREKEKVDRGSDIPHPGVTPISFRELLPLMA